MRAGHANKLVYNNYPWPERPTAKQRAAVETAAQRVLSVRAEFLGFGVPPSGGPVAAKSAPKPPKGGTPTATLADLYDPLAMPPALVKAHADLDRAVDLCYRPQPFESERHRVEFLFARYEKLTAPLIAVAKPKRARKQSAYAKPPPAPSHPSLTPEQAHSDAAHHYGMGKEESPPYGMK